MNMSYKQKNFRLVRNKNLNSIDYQQKGLPTQPDLLELADDYLQLQKELWGHKSDCPWVNEELAIDPAPWSRSLFRLTTRSKQPP